MTTDEEMRDKIQQAIKTAETFSTIYYKKMDSERHNMDKLYLDTATLAWNGNPHCQGIRLVGATFTIWPRKFLFIETGVADRL